MALNHRLLKKGIFLLRLFIFLVGIDILILVCLFLFGSSHPFAWTSRIFLLIILEFFIFWTGIIMTYMTSIQLGLKTRILGIIFGWVPIMHLIFLGKIVTICSREIRHEENLIRRDQLREKDQICKTRYPLLLVHGVFFRDYEHLNYWGRVPKELERNGATVYYGNHNSASSVADSGKELAARIEKIVRESGCEKVNIIAHSKGGLDARAAISVASAGPYIASLTTISTPHRGCEFADYLLNEIPEGIQKAVAARYNQIAVKLGDREPDFLSAVQDLTCESCQRMNEVMRDDPGVFYQSAGSLLKSAVSGKFPMNCTYPLVKHFDGDNDGLVGTDSFPWGDHYIFLKNEKSNRGISHADTIDLTRENIDGFDVREFYVQLVYDLKKKGF